jgi:hypothetical protein
MLSNLCAEVAHASPSMLDNETSDRIVRALLLLTARALLALLLTALDAFRARALLLTRQAAR